MTRGGVPHTVQSTTETGHASEEHPTRIWREVIMMVMAAMALCTWSTSLSRSLVTHTAFILVLITVPVVRCTTGPARQWCASPVAIGTTCILLLLDRTYAYYFAIRHSIVP